MSIQHRLSALERAHKGGACPDCGYPATADTTHANPHDRTIGGICPKCRRLLMHDGRPFGDYWAVGLGERLAFCDGVLIWAADGEPIEDPGHEVKSWPQDIVDAVSPRDGRTD